MELLTFKKKQLIEFKGDCMHDKTKEVETFIGCNLPKEVQIHPPKIWKTKGSGRQIKEGKEKAIEQQQKRIRLCKACGQYGNHDLSHKIMSLMWVRSLLLMYIIDTYYFYNVQNYVHILFCMHGEIEEHV